MMRAVSLQWFGILLFLLTVIFFFPTDASAALTLTAGGSATTTPNVATSITGFQIVGPAASTTPVKLRATSGTLNLSVVSGVTMSGNNSSTVNLSGTVEKLNTALATLTYRRASTGTDTLEVSLVQPTEVFFENNGHLYQYISGSYTWSQARDAAALLNSYGATGYLATITSSAENTFVYQRISGNGWLGTNDIETEKVWKWVTGPEAGTAYFQENPSGGGGNPISGRYHSWASGEPNDYSPGEDCGYMYATQNGEWNDFPCSTPQGYVVEFGGDGVNLPTVVAQNISIVTADVPALTTLSPANGSNSVSPSANLVMTFSKAVTKQTGNILIRKVFDDEVVATIDVASGLVTGTASTTVIINPESNLEEGVQYYVTVPSTAFRDSSSNFFNGIANDSTWVFTIADQTVPVISNIVATSTASTSALITWSTNEAASTRVVYGPTVAYGTVSNKTNTSPRVTSHTVSLSNLLPCTTYHFQVISDDAAANNATSTNSSFTTTGCAAGTTPESTTSTAIEVEDGGTTTASSSGSSLTVDLPEDVTATSSSIVIQIKSIPNNPILSLYGRPSDKPSEVGGVAFDVTAIIDGTTILDSFDRPVTITYTYTDEDVSSLDESSLWLYHYHDNAWKALDDCILDAGSNTISCTTQSFSIFGLFGSEITNVESSGAGNSGTTFLGRINNLLANGNIALAYQLLLEYVTKLLSNKSSFGENLSTIDNINIVEKKDIPTRDLQLGMEGDDVKSLQLFLIAEESGVAANELSRVGASGFYGRYTVEALQEYQSKVGIFPASGYFGPLTRTFISTN